MRHFQTYAVSVEFRAMQGMFARPDVGSESRSYELPTESAARGMLESIQREIGVVVTPVAAGLCSLPRWENYGFNSYSPLRKTSLVTDGDPMQKRMMVLCKPHFVILAVLSPDAYRPGERRYNRPHACQEQMARRLKKSQCFRTPVMGCSEYHCEHFGVPTTPIFEDYKAEIPSLCSVVWKSHPIINVETDYRKQGIPEFREPVKASIDGGVLRYTDQYGVVVVRDGRLTFEDSGLDADLSSFERKAGR